VSDTNNVESTETEVKKPRKAPVKKVAPKAKGKVAAKGKVKTKAKEAKETVKRGRPAATSTVDKDFTFREGTNRAKVFELLAGKKRASAWADVKKALKLDDNELKAALVVMIKTVEAKKMPYEITIEGRGDEKTVAITSK
jgi:hypothetical protein